MTGIEWLFGPPLGGVPESPVSVDSWLSPVERERLVRFRVPKRRSEWLLGRYTSKALVAAVLSREEGRPRDLLSFEIVPERSGAPFVRDTATGAVLPVGVSISHSNGRALAAAVPRGAAPARCEVGADLEWIEPRSEGFIKDFLTEAERAELAAVSPAERPARANGIWSAKEAVLKALKLGLTVDTWKVECLLHPAWVPDAGSLLPAGPAWRRFSAVCAPEILPAGPVPAFLGFWREEEGFVLTLAAALS